MIYKWIIDLFEKIDINTDYDSNYSSFDFYKDYFKTLFFNLNSKINLLHSIFYKYEPFLHVMNPLLLNKIKSLMYKEQIFESRTNVFINKFFNLKKKNSYSFYYKFILQYLHIINKSNVLNEFDLNKIKSLNWGIRRRLFHKQKDSISWSVRSKVIDTNKIDDYSLSLAEKKYFFKKMGISYFKRRFNNTSISFLLKKLFYEKYIRDEEIKKENLKKINIENTYLYTSPNVFDISLFNNVLSNYEIKLKSELELFIEKKEEIRITKVKELDNWNKVNLFINKKKKKQYNKIENDKLFHLREEINIKKKLLSNLDFKCDDPFLSFWKIWIVSFTFKQEKLNSKLDKKNILFNLDFKSSDEWLLNVQNFLIYLLNEVYDSENNEDVDSFTFNLLKLNDYFFSDSTFFEHFKRLFFFKANRSILYFNKLSNYMNLFSSINVSSYSFIQMMQQSSSFNSYINNFIFNKYFFINNSLKITPKTSINFLLKSPYIWSFNHRFLYSKVFESNVNNFFYFFYYSLFKLIPFLFTKFFLNDMVLSKKKLFFLYSFLSTLKKNVLFNKFFIKNKFNWLSFINFFNISINVPNNVDHSSNTNTLLRFYKPIKTREFIKIIPLKKNFIFYYYWRKKNLFFINKLTTNEISLKIKWFDFFSRLYGINNSFLNYFLSWIGYSNNISILRVEQSFFYFFKWLLKTFINFFTLSWYLLYLNQRTHLLPLLKKGLRFIFKYPSRGQRTRSNYRTINKSIRVMNVKSFQKKITSEYIVTKYPNWTNLKTFYFHRF